MRVALLVTDLERGGTPLRLVRLARGLQTAAVRVAVGCLAPRGPLSIELESAGIPTFACDARGPRDIAAIARLRRHVERLRPDVLHASLTHANVAARLVGLATRVPVLTSTATIEVERRWHIWAERLTARLDRGHVVNSVTLANHVQRELWLPARHVHIVPPLPPAAGQSLSRAAARAALGIPEHEFVVAWAGRFDPVKRLEIVVACAEILADAPVRCLIAGAGPHRADLERLIRLSSAARSIDLLGWQDDLGPILAAADVFLFPSLTEGLPNTVLQALAAGLPVVGSDIPALRELAGGESRLLLVTGAEPRRFAAVLRELRDAPERRAALGAAAAAWARAALDPQAAIDATIRLYEAVRRRRR